MVWRPFDSFPVQDHSNRKGSLVLGEFTATGLECLGSVEAAKSRREPAKAVRATPLNLVFRAQPRETLNVLVLAIWRMANNAPGLEVYDGQFQPADTHSA